MGPGWTVCHYSSTPAPILNLCEMNHYQLKGRVSLCPLTTTRRSPTVGHHHPHHYHYYHYHYHHHHFFKICRLIFNFNDFSFSLFREQWPINGHKSRPRCVNPSGGVVTSRSACILAKIETTSTSLLQ